MGRQVKRTVKNSNGDITKLCGVWGSVDKDVAVRRIGADPAAYFVEEESPRVYVRVVRSTPGNICERRPTVPARTICTTCPNAGLQISCRPAWPFNLLARI